MWGASGTCYNKEVIAEYESPLIKEAGIVVVESNLALNGAVVKPSAATPALMKHRGRAVVFENIEDYHERVWMTNLDIGESLRDGVKKCWPSRLSRNARGGKHDLAKKIA